MDNNVDFYRTNAQTFYERTFDLDLSHFYAPFLALIPAGGAILDAGCGSGRDARAFLARGYEVSAFDATPELATLAAKLTGLEVPVMQFADMRYQAAFDGIWSCASLLHVPHDKMLEIFPLFIRALRPGGIWYMSFKYGEGQRIDGARTFSDFTIGTFRSLASRFRDLTVITIWITNDFRHGAAGQRWLNVIARKSR